MPKQPRLTYRSHKRYPQRRRHGHKQATPKKTAERDLGTSWENCVQQHRDGNPEEVGICYNITGEYRPQNGRR